jgi:large subunit ribosomal protein L18
VFRTHKHIYAQLIDDAAGKTLVSASTMDKQIREGLGFGGNKQAAEAIGRAVAERAIAAGVKKICFDRGEFRYHGRVAALADAAAARPRLGGVHAERHARGVPGDRRQRCAAPGQS